LYIYKNNVLINTVVDGSSLVASGYPGIGAYPATDPLTNVQFSNVSGGTFSTATYASQSSPILELAGQVYDAIASASIADTWSIQDVIANAEDGSSTLTISHTGSTGLATVSLPAIILTASSTPTSAGTPGTAGQFAWDTTNLYFCSVSGPGGGATQWNKLVLVPII
jgi:hypothetical protein